MISTIPRQRLRHTLKQEQICQQAELIQLFIHTLVSGIFLKLGTNCWISVGSQENQPIVCD